MLVKIYLSKCTYLLICCRDLRTAFSSEAVLSYFVRAFLSNCTSSPATLRVQNYQFELKSNLTQYSRISRWNILQRFSPADRAGLEKMDYVWTVNGKEVIYIFLVSDFINIILIGIIIGIIMLCETSSNLINVKIKSTIKNSTTPH